MRYTSWERKGRKRKRSQQWLEQTRNHTYLEKAGKEKLWWGDGINRQAEHEAMREPVCRRRDSGRDLEMENSSPHEGHIAGQNKYLGPWGWLPVSVSAAGPILKSKWTRTRVLLVAGCPSFSETSTTSTEYQGAWLYWSEVPREMEPIWHVDI